LFSADELSKLSASEIYEKVSEALFFHDYKWQEEKLIEYENGNCINGLENVLHSCLACGSRFSIIQENNNLKCTECGFAAKADNYGFFESNSKVLSIRHPAEWEEYLHLSLKKEIKESSDFSYTSTAVIKKLDKENRIFSELGKGSVKVSKESILVTVESGDIVYNERVTHFPILPMIPGEYFDLQDGITVFRCFPDEKKDVVYFTDIVTCISEINSGE